jgi:hypothetical protein
MMEIAAQHSHEEGLTGRVVPIETTFDAAALDT